MKILFINNVVPYPLIDGGRLRRYHLLLALAAEHEVCLLAAAPEPESLVEFSALHPEIRVVPVAPRPDTGRIPIAQAARELLAREQFDVVHIVEFWQWPGDRALVGRKVVFDSDNIQTVLLERLGAVRREDGGGLAPSAVEALERQAYRRADRILACSAVDAARIRSMSDGSPVTIVPNGVDLERYRLLSRPEPNDSPIVTFTGMLAYAPNADAVSYFVREIWPAVRAAVPGARFRIVGRFPPAEVLELQAIPGVEVLGDVPEIMPYFEEAHVMVVPLRAGSGTRLKILEALAVGRPVVTTRIGCEGLDVVTNRHLLIADEPEAFARGVINALAFPQSCDGWIRQGRRLVETQYDWRRIGLDLRKVYEGLAAEDK